MFADLLLPMFDDEYYPDILVAEVKQHVETFAKKIVKAKSEGDIYQYLNFDQLADYQASMANVPIETILAS